MSQEYYVQVLMSGYEMLKVSADNEKEAGEKACGYANRHLSRNYTSVYSLEIKPESELVEFERQTSHTVD